MQQNVVNNNNSLRYIIAGVMLFLASWLFVLAYRSDSTAVELSYTFGALAITSAASSVFYKAFRQGMTARDI